MTVTDGINTITSSFVATYDILPLCVGVIGTAGTISSGLISQHAYTYYIDPTIFSSPDGDALTYSLDTTSMSPAAFAGGDTVSVTASNTI